MLKKVGFIFIVLIFLLVSCRKQKVSNSETSLPGKSSAESSQTESGSSSDNKETFTDEALDKLDKETLSVKKYGAAGDGKTDDSDAIIDALKKVQGPVYFPKGDYVLKKPITIISNNSGIFGEKDAEGKPLANLLVTCEETTVTAKGKNNLVINGINFNKTFVDNSVAYAVNISNGKQISIKNCEISGYSARGGIHIGYSDTFEISNNYIHDFSASAIGILSDGEQVDSLAIAFRNSKNGKILNNTIKNILIKDPLMSANNYQSDGITTFQSDNIHIEGNYVYNAGEGIDVSMSTNVMVYKNTFEHCNHFGMKMVHGTKNSVFDSNTVIGAAMNGVSIEPGHATSGVTRDNKIINNTIKNTGSHNPWGDKEFNRAGIVLGGNPIFVDGILKNGVTNNLIENNTILDENDVFSTKYGVFEREVAFGNIIRNNNIGDYIPNEIVINTFDPNQAEN